MTIIDKIKEAAAFLTTNTGRLPTRCYLGIQQQEDLAAWAAARKPLYSRPDEPRVFVMIAGCEIFEVNAPSHFHVC